MSVNLRSAERVAAGLAVAALLIAPSGRSLSAQSASPELPRVLVDTSYAPPGNTINVPSGGNLQTAINNAAPGSRIVLQAGASYGAVTLPNKSGSGWIYIMSNGSLPAPGNRVSPSDASQLARIVVSTTQAIGTSGGAHHFRFIGIEISVTGTMSGAVVSLSGSPEPHHIIIDRCYIHGTTGGTQRRGVQMHGQHLAVVDSYVADFKDPGADSQAIASWNGSGPIKIQNNYLSAAGENVMFGGADPSSGTIGPSDIEIRSNYFFKPLGWKSASWVVKNLLEFKNSRRVLVEGNVLENNWAASQNGFSILLTPRNQDGSCSGCGTQDITIRRNILLNGEQGLNISGDDNNFPSTRTNRVLIEQNQFTVSGSANSGRGIQLTRGPVNVVVNHNTWLRDGTFSFSENSPKSTGFVFTNNIVPDGAYGFTGTGSGTPLTTLSMHYTSAVMTGNAILAASPTNYPSGNFFPNSVTAATMNGTDGKRVGADAALLSAATFCAVSGQCGDEPPPPPPPAGDTTAPTVSVTSPSAGATVSGQVVVAASASDNVGVDSVQFQVNDANLGSAVTGAPFTASWTTTGSPNGSYTLTAIARDDAGNTRTSAAVTVTVNNVAVPPPSALAISAVSASSITTLGATVSWTTNIGASTQVEYGTTATYGNATALNSAMVTAHGAGLSGLSAGTTYHYRVKSQSSSGQLSASGDFTFTTAAAPPPPPPPSTTFTISNVSILRINSTTYAFAWQTSEPATSQIEGGFTTSYITRTPVDTRPVTSHYVVVSANVPPGTTFHYRVVSTNATGVTKASGDFIFTVPRPWWMR